VYIIKKEGGSRLCYGHTNARVSGSHHGHGLILKSILSFSGNADA
jgi:hypothetical protein